MFFKHAEENLKRKRSATDGLKEDIDQFRQETQRLLGMVQQWFQNTHIQTEKTENSLIESCAPDVIYHMPAMTLINETKRLHITPRGLYFPGGVRGCVRVSLSINEQERTLFECRLHDSRADFDEWAIIDGSNKKPVVPFTEESFFSHIAEFA
ncbi:hypothetical protein C1N62_18025 (plasmid) [Nissabacter sp. SGAir0207]|nr:hypothetical protein C1N62_18025 [Nissabacter sp. SGAir0207]